jgi:hypothetical protein
MAITERTKNRAANYRKLASELGAYAARQEAKGRGYEEYAMAARAAAPMVAAAMLAYEAGDVDAGKAAEAMLEAFRAEGNNRSMISPAWAACGLMV